MKISAMVLVLCVALSGCLAARSGSKNVSSNMNTNEVELRLNLVEAHIKNNQPQLALQELVQVESSASNLSRFHFDSGMIYMQLNELEKSRAGFAEAVEIDDDFGEAWNNLGKIEEALKHPKEAEAAYLKALNILTYLTPEFPAYNLGLMMVRQGKNKEAEQYARKALSRNWRYIPAYKLLADSLIAQNRMEDAESVLKSGLDADMSSMSTLLALGELRVRMGKNEQAREIFQKIITQSPQSNEAKVAKDYLGLL